MTTENNKIIHKHFKTSNIILYCRNWHKTVAFYRDAMGLPVNFSNDWFIEFILSPVSRLSIADEKRASVKSCNGQGITVTLEVDDIKSVHEFALKAGMNPENLKAHPWGAQVFYMHDPEGHRIEIWQPS
jgi:catechol 2,3-dioxygenase-like lactoylglutathione lyase family enzyme